MNVRPHRFPMRDGPSIDWATAQEIYAEYVYLYGTDQTLERLAERGGFGWAEVAEIHKRYTKKKNARNWIG